MIGAPDSVEQALLGAVQEMMTSMARLLVAHGVPFSTVEEYLKVAMVQAGREAALRARPGALPHRLVSKVSASTGINRREVTRLIKTEVRQTRQRPSPSLQVFARWTSDPTYLTPDGHPIALPRQGPGPSFERLAAAITRDVHHRSILDDLVRLKAVEWNEQADEVAVSGEMFVPRHDLVRMLAYLRDNVGDHLSAAVDNVIGGCPAHLEQAVIAAGLSEQSVLEVKPLAEAQWKNLLASLVPEIQKRIDADEASGRDTERRMRIGMYAYSPSGPATPDSRSEDTDHE